LPTLKLKLVNKLRNSDEYISVGVGEYKIACGDSGLSTWGLGSCVAIIIYDSAARIGGLAHALLPEPRDGARWSAKYASIAVKLIVRRMTAVGASRESLEAVLVGGANIIPKLTINTGMRNVDAAKRALKELGVKLVGEDVGGSRGRNVVFMVSEGVVLVSYTSARLFGGGL